MTGTRNKARKRRSPPLHSNAEHCTNESGIHAKCRRLGVCKSETSVCSHCSEARDQDVRKTVKKSRWLRDPPGPPAPIRTEVLLCLSRLVNGRLATPRVHVLCHDCHCHQALMMTPGLPKGMVKSWLVVELLSHLLLQPIDGIAILCPSFMT